MKISSILFAFFLSIAACVGCMRVSEGPRLSEPEQRSLAVAISHTCYTPQGISRNGGSGVIVQTHVVITAYHVIECAGLSKIEITSRDGVTYQATVLQAMPDVDLASLVVASKLASRPLGWASARADETLCAEAGIPTFSRRCGRVSKLSDRPGADVMHTIQVVNGNSGGGTYNAKGQLVAIITMSWEHLILKNRGGLSVSILQHRECLLASLCNEL